MRKKVISKIIIIFAISLSIIGCTQIIDNEKINENEVSEVIDMAGRSVLLPETVDKVFSTGPEGTILLYTLNPKKMAGWNYELREGEKNFIADEYHRLPNLGGAGKESINIEEVLKVDPSIIIMMETINDTSIAKADDITERTGKPVFVIDININRIDRSYEFLGDILGEEEKAKELSKYCRGVLDEAKKNVSKIMEDKKVRLYYAEGPNGLQTEPGGSWHAEIIEMAGGVNVAEVVAKEGKGKSEVSIEQLLYWNPELIISWDDERGGYYSKIFKDENWKDIKAVEKGEVYEIPNKPFNWFDRPPSVNRILGLKWLGNLLYPKIFDYDIREEVKEFYNMFYHYTLSDLEVTSILENSIRNKD